MYEGEFAGDEINEMSFQKFDHSAQPIWTKAGNLACQAMSPPYVSLCLNIVRMVAFLGSR